MSSPDLTTATRPSIAAAVARPSLVSRLVTRYIDGWTWYVAAGGSGPAPEPGYPARRHGVFAACSAAVRRTAPRFALLFGGATGR